MSLMYIYVYNNGSHKRRGAKKQSPIYGKSPFMAFTMTVSIVANPQFKSRNTNLCRVYMYTCGVTPAKSCAGSTMALRSVPMVLFLTLGTHAQRGLWYLVCVCDCLCVCYSTSHFSRDYSCQKPSQRRMKVESFKRFSLETLHYGARAFPVGTATRLVGHF